MITNQPNLPNTVYLASLSSFPSNDMQPFHNPGMDLCSCQLSGFQDMCQYCICGRYDAFVAFLWTSDGSIARQHDVEQGIQLLQMQ